MSGFLWRLLAVLIFSAILSSENRAQGWHHLGDVQDVESLKDGMILTAGKAKVGITAVRDGIVRVRLAPTGTFPKDFSWAIVQAPDAPPVSIEEGTREVRMIAGDVTVVVNKTPLLIKFSNNSGATILEDEPSLPMAWDGDNIHVWKRMPLDENYFGLGDKAGHMNRRNRSFTMWNTDEFGWQESSDPLYKDIPFLWGCATEPRTAYSSTMPTAAVSILAKSRWIIFLSERWAEN